MRYIWLVVLLAGCESNTQHELEYKYATCFCSNNSGILKLNEYRVECRDPWRQLEIYYLNETMCSGDAK